MMTTLIRDRYEVLTTVGRGGEGEVVKALDRQHDRPVALKSRIAGPGVDRRLVLSEARMLLSLEPHPNLPLVRDDFFEGDRHWLVMDWVEGRNLASVLADRPGTGLPPHEVLNAIEQVAGALDHLHRHDPPVIHRDLKPSNLIRQPDGTVVLVDFGVSGSRTGWGTRGFRAPELAMGAATPTADVYGLAATTFALLTGDRPRAGTDAWATIPAGGVVERTIRRALSTDPERRHHSATAFVSDLRSWLEPSMPEGTVTFLLTDVEGSVRLWEEHPEAMARALDRHDEIVATAVAQHGGVLVKSKGEGDSTFAVFHHAEDAVACAARIQQRFRRERWPTPTPMRVRIALHTGEAQPRDGDYFGPVVNRAARLRAAVHGGQTVLTAATAAFVRDGVPATTALADLGEHRLRDLAQPVRIYEMRVEGIEETFPPLRSLDERPHNLPIELTSFIGRERELQELRSLLERARTVTLTGEGGAGKTRLALQVAAESGAAYEDGTWLIDLAPLIEPLVTATAVQALQITVEREEDPFDALTRALRTKKVLLILDNCEHLIDDVARFAHDLLSATPGTTVLATSREPLSIPGEAIWRIPALELPAEDAGPDTAAAAAVRLFLDRAALASPGVQDAADSIQAAARICRRLDGIPLAIELAAAALHTTTPAAVEQALGDRFGILTGGPRTALPRQRTLEAALDWSYETLDAEERRLLLRLAVFSGGWTADAAAAVAGGDAHEVLGRLLHRSMIVDDGGAPRRFRMLETIREYAATRAGAADDVTAAREAHLVWCTATVRDLASQLTGVNQKETLSAIDREHDNVRAALRYAIDGGRVEAAVELAAAATPYWITRGLMVEGAAWLEEALGAARSPPEGVEARGAEALGSLAFARGTYPVAQEHAERALSLYRKVEDAPGIARVNVGLGKAASMVGDYDAARALFEEALEHRALLEPDVVANCLLGLGQTASHVGRHAEARTYLDEALAIRRNAGDRQGEAVVLVSLGIVAYQEGDPRGSTAFAEQARSIFRDLRFPQGVANTTLNIGVNLFAQGELDRARPELQAALDVYREIGDERGIATATLNLGGLMLDRGELDTAEELLRQSLELHRGLGMKALEAYCLENLGSTVAPKRPEEARHLWEAALDIRREIGETFTLPKSHLDLCELDIEEHELQGAAAHLRAALDIMRETDRRARDSARAYLLASRLMLDLNKYETAARLLGTWDAERENNCLGLVPANRSLRERMIGSLREELGDDLEQHLAAGRALEPGDAQRLIRQELPAAEGVA